MPQSRRIFIDGRNVLEFSPAERQEVRKTIGMSFQYSALFDSMPVFGNVGVPPAGASLAAQKLRAG